MDTIIFFTYFLERYNTLKKNTRSLIFKTVEFSDFHTEKDSEERRIAEAFGHIVFDIQYKLGTVYPFFTEKDGDLIKASIHAQRYMYFKHIKMLHDKYNLKPIPLSSYDFETKEGKELKYRLFDILGEIRVCQILMTRYIEEQKKEISHA